MKLFRSICRAVLIVSGSSAVAGIATSRAAPQGPPLANVEVLIVRHAEKPADGKLLNAAGVARANAYVAYFKNLKIDGQAVHLDHIFATAESKNSDRERLTVAPLAKSLGLTVDDRYKNKAYGDLADDVRTHRYGHELLICWHHGNIPAIVTALQGDSAKLFPTGKWADDHFDWLVELHYDALGRIQPNKTKLIHEHLMPGDQP
jgi:hypothetical protein